MSDSLGGQLETLEWHSGRLGVRCRGQSVAAALEGRMWAFTERKAGQWGPPKGRWAAKLSKQDEAGVAGRGRRGIHREQARRLGRRRPLVTWELRESRALAGRRQTEGDSNPRPFISEPSCS